MLALLLLGACAEPDSPYFPLGPGRWWQYHVAVSNSATRWEYKMLSKNLEPVSSDGERLAARRLHNGEIHYFRRTADGVWHVGARTSADDPPPAGPVQLSMPLPPSESRVWDSAERTRVLRTRAANDDFRDYRVELPVHVRYRVAETAAQVSTRSGAFHDCLRIEGTASAQFDLGIDIGHVRIDVAISDWYAPGVGLVRRERHERTDSPFINDGDYLMELETWGK